MSQELERTDGRIRPLASGMDHGHYMYSALPQRISQPWPEGRWLAAYAVLFLEHWELLPAEGALRDPGLAGEFFPDFRTWTQREYGLRVGIFRIIEALKAQGVQPCIAANAMAVERLPGFVKVFSDWGCEWLGHGVAATRMMHSKMPHDAQAAYIEKSLHALERATGRRPLGWLSQDWGTSPDTFELLAQAGVRYTLDFPNDEQPYWLRTEPPLLAIPFSAEWDDVQCQWLRHAEPRAHAQLTCEAFERIARECASQRRSAVFNLSIHPWLSGMPSRVAAFRDMLARLRAAPGVWWTGPAQLHAACEQSRTQQVQVS
jgi:peptidoglycan/xylan/chitin deacetylase (PgdA/CDA1 family)